MQNSKAESFALHVNRTSVPLAVWKICGTESWVISINCLYVSRYDWFHIGFCQWIMGSGSGCIACPDEIGLVKTKSCTKSREGWLSIYRWVFIASILLFLPNLCASQGIWWQIKAFVDYYLLNDIKEIQEKCQAWVEYYAKEKTSAMKILQINTTTDEWTREKMMIDCSWWMWTSNKLTHTRMQTIPTSTHLIYRSNLQLREKWKHKHRSCRFYTRKIQLNCENERNWRIYVCRFIVLEKNNIDLIGFGDWFHLAYIMCGQTQRTIECKYSHHAQRTQTRTLVLDSTTIGKPHLVHQWPPISVLFTTQFVFHVFV